MFVLIVSCTLLNFQMDYITCLVPATDPDGGFTVLIAWWVLKHRVIVARSQLQDLQNYEFEPRDHP